MLDQDNELDQLIRVINKQTFKGTTSQAQHKSQFDIPFHLPPLKKQTSLTVTKPKFLTFKPWSGMSQLSQKYISEPIKQQIQNQQKDQQYDEERQEYMQQSKTNQNINNTTNNNQIGYFYKFVSGRVVKLIKCLLDQNGFQDCHSLNNNWTFYWSSIPIPMQQYRKLLPYQKINHFPNSFHLTRKDLMNKTVSKMQIKYGITHYNFLPKTFILPKQLDLLLEQHNRCPQTYIVKPHNRSQGRGITVTNSLEIIYAKLQKYSSLIVSHYIDNPLLINRLKFDLRIYVAITGINPLRIYVYEEGLARFATQEYDSSGYDSQNKKYQHLTNYSVNKNNQNFVPSNNQNQEYYGSKWSLTALKDFLTFNVGKAETTDLFDRIDEVIVKTIISGQNLLYTTFQNNVPYINGCYQVLGFDIMIDSNLKPWLIEVNHSPSMNTDSSLDLKIKGNMIADLFTMAGVTPLGQRYIDGGHIKYQSRHYFDERKNNQSAVDKFILKEVQMEYERRGDWRRVFPTLKNLKYKQYFQVDRYFNKLMREKLLQGSASIQSNPLKQKRATTTQKTSATSSKNPSAAQILRIKKPVGPAVKKKSFGSGLIY